jgi:hypothetical protein
MHCNWHKACFRKEGRTRRKDWCSRACIHMMPPDRHCVIQNFLQQTKESREWSGFNEVHVVIWLCSFFFLFFSLSITASVVLGFSTRPLIQWVLANDGFFVKLVVSSGSFFFPLWVPPVLSSSACNKHSSFAVNNFLRYPLPFLYWNSVASTELTTLWSPYCVCVWERERARERESILGKVCAAGP